MSDFERDLANVMESFIETELDYIEKSSNELEEVTKERDLYKEVIEEVREYITIYRSYANINGKDYLKDRDEIGELDTEQVDKVLQILDKAGSKND